MAKDGDWAAAAAAVRARHKPGDLVAFAPDWIDPVGRYHLGDLIPIEMAARMDDRGYRTLWEVSIRGADSPEARARSLEWSQQFGTVLVRQLVREPAAVVTDFVAEFRSAKIAGRAVGRPRVQLEEVGFGPRRCIRVEPHPDQTVTITYSDVALGNRLVGYVGLADIFTRRDIRDPGELTVRIDGQEQARVLAGVGDRGTDNPADRGEPGWQRFAITTEPSTRAAVVFEARAVGPNARRRLLCFAAEARHVPLARLGPGGRSATEEVAQ